MLVEPSDCCKVLIAEFGGYPHYVLYFHIVGVKADHVREDLSEMLMV